MAGRPRKIASPQQLSELVDEYVQECIGQKTPITWTGMCIHLGFSSRQSLDEYANYEGYSDPIKKAKLLVERYYEQRLSSNSPAGAIFALKNMGWSDRQEMEHSGPNGGPIPIQAQVTFVKPSDAD